MRKEPNFNYFDSFMRMGEKSSQAAAMLVEILDDFTPETVEERMKAMHRIEHEADLEQHRLMQHLAKEFITPIEREDIVFMARQLDEVTDGIDDVMQHIYMYNIQSITEDARQMAAIIAKCCQAVESALSEFHNFKHAPNIHERIVEINRLEEDGDRMYILANRKLFSDATDPIFVQAWSKTYTQLEKCCDDCEHIADAMESIIMKNS